MCMKTQKTHALFHILLLSLLCTIAGTATASERADIFELHMSVGSDGLVTNEPQISQQQLNDALIENKYLINVRSNKLKEFIEENQITTKTGIIAAVMPGGLIYLALRKAGLSDANNKLEILQADLNDLQSDTIALHVEDAPILAAHFP